MKILVDENIPRSAVAALRDIGHDVLDVRGTFAQGSADSALWSMAIAEGRVLITTDRGFAEYRRNAHAGLLIVRLRQPNRERIHDAVMLGFQRFEESEWPGLLVVVRDHTLSVSRTGGSIERW